MVDRMHRVIERVLKRVEKMMNLNLNGRAVALKSIEIENVVKADYPDFCDAFIGYAEFVDGTELKEWEIAQLESQNDTLVNELAHKKMF